MSSSHRHPHAVPLLHDALYRAARTRPDQVALVCDEQRVTYARLAAAVDALAATLAARGVGRGDRVMIYGENTVETAVAFWAALAANGVAVMVNPQTRPGRLAWLLEDCRPAALITEAHLHRGFGDVAPACPHLRTVIVAGALPDGKLAALPGGTAWAAALEQGRSAAPPPRACIDHDLAALIYTSGSTGDPKGVMHTHRSMRAAASAIGAYLDYRADDVILDVLPLSFDYGLYQLIMSVRAGARLVLERSFGYPARVLDRIERERVTTLPGVPTLFALLAELRSLADRDLSSLRCVTNTGAALPLKHIEMLRAVWPTARIFSMYGLTECKRVSYLPPEDLAHKPRSVGIAIPNTELWIADAAGNRLPPDTVGQIIVRGATLMRGYWEKPEATARKLKPGPLPGEQVLWTGDYGRLDADGYLYFVGRMDDIIKSRGEKVAPREVEDALVHLRGVKEAAVIGVPDPVLGEAIKAFVVPEAGASLDPRTLQRGCMAVLESYKVPTVIEVVDALPLTDSGKIKKNGLS